MTTTTHHQLVAQMLSALNRIVDCQRYEDSAAMSVVIGIAEEAIAKAKAACTCNHKWSGVMPGCPVHDL